MLLRNDQFNLISCFESAVFVFSIKNDCSQFDARRRSWRENANYILFINFFLPAPAAVAAAAAAAVFD